MVAELFKAIFAGLIIYGKIIFKSYISLNQKFTTMKKLYVLIIPVLFLMYACDNKPAAETAVVSLDTIPVVDTPKVVEPPVGAPAMPAEVFEDATTIDIAGAKVIIKENARIIESLITDEKGIYTCTKLVAGHTYTFTCSKAGYITQSATALYENPDSRPYFGLKK